jgi:hypothetical protein
MPGDFMIPLEMCGSGLRIGMPPMHIKRTTILPEFRIQRAQTAEGERLRAAGLGGALRRHVPVTACFIGVDRILPMYFPIKDFGAFGVKRSNDYWHI